MRVRSLGFAIILVAFICAAVAACGSTAQQPAQSPAETVVREPAGSSSATGETAPAPPPVDEHGVVTAIATVLNLSPQARMLAENLKCVCGCNMRLGRCSCEKDPGGLSMKRHLQSLFDRGLTPTQVRAEMVKTYGTDVLP